MYTDNITSQFVFYTARVRDSGVTETNLKAYTRAQLSIIVLRQNDTLSIRGEYATDNFIITSIDKSLKTYPRVLCHRRSLVRPLCLNISPAAP